MEIKSGQIIKGVQLAVILGLSERHIRRLANENVIKKNVDINEKGKKEFIKMFNEGEK